MTVWGVLQSAALLVYPMFKVILVELSVCSYISSTIQVDLSFQNIL